MTDAEVTAWGVKQWQKLRPEQRTNQKWADILAACRSLRDHS